MTIEAANKLGHFLVEFSYEDPASPTLEYYTSRTVNYGTSPLYVAVPELSVRPAPNTGALDEKALVIEGPLDGSMPVLDYLATGEVVSPVYVTVTRVLTTPSGGSVETYVDALRWLVMDAIRNPSGRKGLLRLECASVKRRLGVPLGMAANPQCIWTLGDRGCQVDVASHDQNTTVSAVDAADPKKITVSGFTAFAPPGGTAGSFFLRGYMEKDGIRIGIQHWVPGSPTTIYLVENCPAAWVGQSVLAVPGCDGSITTCRERWDNEERFCGHGIAMPDYHPDRELS